MYSSTYFPLAFWGDVAIFLFWCGWDFVELVDIVAYVFHDTAWTPVKPQWRLLKAFGGVRGRVRSNLVRIQLDLSFRVAFGQIWAYPVGFGAYPVGFGAYPVGFGAYPVGLGAYPVGLGAYQVGFEGKISIGALDTANGQGQWGHWSGSLGYWKAMGVGQGQWGHWKGSMQARVNGAIGQSQWGYWKGSMGALVRVNGGIEKDQFRRWSGSMQALSGSMGYWKGSMGYWTRGAQWGYWKGSMASGSVLKRVVSSTLQGCKLYLTGL